MSFELLALKLTAYEKALQLQQKLFNENISNKTNGFNTKNTLILLEHLPVYTLGKSGNLNNLIVPIEQTDAEFHKTDRGGDITFHGPGQLVGYPIFDLESLEMGVKEYVYNIEECIISVCEYFNLKSGRIKSASGVWIEKESSKPEKICALGIKISRGISMHGFAFNIHTDLSYFQNIVPCGIEDKGVTSLSKELGHKISIEEVSPLLILEFKKRFIDKRTLTV